MLLLCSLLTHAPAESTANKEEAPHLTFFVHLTPSYRRVLEFSKDILEVAQEVMLPRTNDPVRIRVGLHTGESHGECYPCLFLVSFSVLTFACTLYADRVLRVLAECPSLLHL